MSTISVTNTLANGQTPAASLWNTNYSDLVNGHNNHDSGTSRWTVMDATAIKKGGFTAILPLQIVQATSTTAFNTSNTAYQTTNLTASITPQSTSSKILVFATGTLASNGSANGISVAATLARGGTNILTAAGFAQTDLSTTSASYIGITPCSLIYQDSPASTSALTYAIQIKVVSGASTAQWGTNSTTQVLVLIETL